MSINTVNDALNALARALAEGDHSAADEVHATTSQWLQDSESEDAWANICNAVLDAIENQ